jgi:hypothetical protein
VKIRLAGGLPFVTATIEFAGQKLALANVLLDTGSASSIFSTDRLLDVGVELEPQDPIYRIRGVGGTEFVFGKQVDALAPGTLVVRNFEVEVGALDYGFDLDGIVGTDFLIEVGALIDLFQLEVRGGAQRSDRR